MLIDSLSATDSAIFTVNSSRYYCANAECEYLFLTPRAKRARKFLGFLGCFVRGNRQKTCLKVVNFDRILGSDFVRYYNQVSTFGFQILSDIITRFQLSRILARSEP